MRQRKMGRYTVNVSNETKIFFPQNKITKGDLLNYYENISDYMLLHIRNRPLMVHRFPDGINGEAFYQKNTPEYYPKWIKQVKVPLKDRGYTNFTVCQNAATLVYLANQAMITPHIWLSKDDKLNYPDKLIFDLDPSINNFRQVCKTAYDIKQLLEKLGLIPYVMTTGSHGLHVVCPIDRFFDFIQIREFAINCSLFLINNDTNNLTIELRKEKRGKKIFIDTLRNQFGATSVAPYGVRAHPKAPIATPLYWEELNDINLTSQKFNILNIFDRIKIEGDPWHDFFKNRKSLRNAYKEIKKILGI